MDFKQVSQNLQARGFTVTTCATAAEAALYLDGAIDQTTVGFGGSMTLEELGLFDKLSAHNQVFAHWHGTPTTADGPAATAEVYLTSVNGLAETGELLNIDGNGNRVASTLYGHKIVYFVIGSNKIAPTYDEALWRARNIAAPKNAQRLGRKTPCAAKGDRCYDCNSPERICRGLAVLWQAMNGCDMRVVLVDEPLGY